MKIITNEIKLETQGDTDIINITEKVSSLLTKSKLNEGVVFLFVVGSTAGLTTCEYEPALVSDLRELFEKIVPKDASYAHDSTWGDANGYSHLRASLLGPSLTIPFIKGQLILGTWQQIVLIDFDNRPRQRNIIAQIQGE